jgi:phosphopantothenoylcysteine decarboxylase / phosphopantothenate---cysteine ligase
MSQKRNMMNWDLNPPAESTQKDNDIQIVSQALAGKRICLLICGSIAAYKAPDIVRSLRRHSATVHTIASQSALQFVTIPTLAWTSGQKVVTSLTTDAEHLAGNLPFDIYLVAPATYNTINKFAGGIADSPLTLTLAAALGYLESSKSKIFMVPCMHGSMHNSFLIKSMQQLQLAGVNFIKPKQEDGKDKLPEPDELVDELINALSHNS